MLLPQKASSYQFNHGCVLARPKIAEPVGECWPDIKILNELGKGLTPEEYWYDDYRGFLDELLEPTGLDFEGFVERGFLKWADQFKKYQTKGFKTDTGKAELSMSMARELGVSPMPEIIEPVEEDKKDYPLVLTSKKSRFYLHSSYRWRVINSDYGWWFPEGKARSQYDW